MLIFRPSKTPGSFCTYVQYCEPRNCTAREGTKTPFSRARSNFALPSISALRMRWLLSITARTLTVRELLSMKSPVAVILAAKL